MINEEKGRGVVRFVEVIHRKNFRNMRTSYNRFARLVVWATMISGERVWLHTIEGDFDSFSVKKKELMAEIFCKKYIGQAVSYHQNEEEVLFADEGQFGDIPYKEIRSLESQIPRNCEQPEVVRLNLALGRFTYADKSDRDWANGVLQSGIILDEEDQCNYFFGVQQRAEKRFDRIVKKMKEWGLPPKSLALAESRVDESCFDSIAGSERRFSCKCGRVAEIPKKVWKSLRPSQLTTLTCECGNKEVIRK